MTFYIENLTPIPGYFTVDATNYGPAEDCIHHVLVKGRTRTVGAYRTLSRFHLPFQNPSGNRSASPVAAS
jgi:hypothetical protein